MSEHNRQWFHFGPWVFDVDAALDLIAAASRDTRPLDVDTWAQAYGLTYLDDPDSHTIGLIGPTRDGFDRAYAMTTDLTNPVLLAQVAIEGHPPAPLLIDGTHRLYRAWRDGVARLPAHVLTAAEIRQIQHDVRLGPGPTRLTPPR